MMETFEDLARRLLEIVAQKEELEAEEKSLRKILLNGMLGGGIPQISTPLGTVSLAKVSPRFSCEDLDAFIQRMGSSAQEYLEVPSSKLTLLSRKDPAKFLSLFEAGVIKEVSEATWKLVCRVGRKNGNEQ